MGKLKKKLKRENRIVHFLKYGYNKYSIDRIREYLHEYDINIYTDEGYSLLYYAFGTKFSYEKVKLLLELGADPNQTMFDQEITRGETLALGVPLFQLIIVTSGLPSYMFNLNVNYNEERIRIIKELIKHGALMTDEMKKFIRNHIHMPFMTQLIFLLDGKEDTKTLLKL